MPRLDPKGKPCFTARFRSSHYNSRVSTPADIAKMLWSSSPHTLNVAPDAYDVPIPGTRPTNAEALSIYTNFIRRFRDPASPNYRRIAPTSSTFP